MDVVALLVFMLLVFLSVLRRAGEEARRRDRRPPAWWQEPSQAEPHAPPPLMWPEDAPRVPRREQDIPLRPRSPADGLKEVASLLPSAKTPEGEGVSIEHPDHDQHVIRRFREQEGRLPVVSEPMFVVEQDQWVSGIVLSEILGRPRALRPYRSPGLRRRA